MDRKMLSFVENVQKAFSCNNPLRLKQLSNKAIETAALTSDKTLAELSLIAYSLSKLISKEHVVKSPRWPKVRKSITDCLGRAASCLLENREADFSRTLGRITGIVSKTDEGMGNYILNLYSKARVKQASRAYAVGMSLSSAADLTGADKKRLLEYIGATKIHEEGKSRLPISERIRHLKEESE